jgi:hypothetical protein
MIPRTPAAFLRLARRFYCSREWRSATNPPQRLADAFRAAYNSDAVPRAWKDLAWKVYGACGPVERPRARWFRQLEAKARWRRMAAEHPPGKWDRGYFVKLARALWFDADPRDRDQEAFRLP